MLTGGQRPNNCGPSCPYSPERLRENLSEALPALVGSELPDEQPEEALRVGSGGVLSMVTPL